MGDISVKVDVDAVIVGGGIAGLWTLARLRDQGFNAVLLEDDALGAGQTRYSQGIIHGGTKYALTGKLTASSEAVSAMPSIWRACHAGKGEVDLRKAVMISDAHYLWSTTSLTSKITGFFASRVMRARTTALKPQQRPAIFQHRDFRGSIYRLDEPVFDCISVLQALAEPSMRSIVAVRKDSIRPQVSSLLVETTDGQGCELNFSKLVLMAGQGNQSLLSAAGLQKPVMQLRPLKMVMMRGGLVNKVFAHCMGAGINPRVTITSHTDDDGNIVWYLGGQLAEDGVNRTDEEQIARAQRELAELIPWQKLDTAQWGVLDIDRAEVRHADGHRPDTFYATQQGNIITAWPTKLALAPLLAQQIVDYCSTVEKTDNELPAWPAPPFAKYPWCEPARWNGV
ncbi:MAG: FAD-dependent oxidoreductase [Thiotrichales bacterium]|nr:MAG: FAD-dependent oxidoreductase [Thiotrichales bacterium]